VRSFSDLRNFCEYIVKRYGSPDRASEEDKADEFRRIYLRNMPSNLKVLRAIATACGIHLNGLEEKVFPENVRGYHDVFEGKRSIYYRKNDTVSGIENTILHEFREMIEPVFAQTCRDYEQLRTIAVHRAANSFATSVLLPRDAFKAAVYKMGLDIVGLANLYRKSCTQILLRMEEVLQSELFFYGALYENSFRDGDEWKVTCWASGQNEECPEANVSGLYGFFPRKGHPVVPESLVDMTIKTGKPHIVQHITIVDEVEYDGLTAIAQPLFLPEPSLSKVALVVLLQSESEKLLPQVKRLRPTIVESFYKHL